MDEEEHCKVLYREGPVLRSLVGPVRESKFEGFLEVVRPGGVVQVNKRAIIWIGPAEWRSGP